MEGRGGEVGEGRGREMGFRSRPTSSAAATARCQGVVSTVTHDVLAKAALAKTFPHLHKMLFLGEGGRVAVTTCDIFARESLESPNNIEAPPCAWRHDGGKEG